MSYIIWSLRGDENSLVILGMEKTKVAEIIELICILYKRELNWTDN